jgi:hypothetical protein
MFHLYSIEPYNEFWWNLMVGSITFIGWTFQVALSQNHIWEEEPEAVHFVWPSCWAGRRAAANNMPHTKLLRPVLCELLRGTQENMSHLCEAYRVWRFVWWKSRKVRQYVLTTVLSLQDCYGLQETLLLLQDCYGLQETLLSLQDCYGLQETLLSLQDCYSLQETLLPAWRNISVT